jgi:putative peptidoglycan lipid II flippase
VLRFAYELIPALLLGLLLGYSFPSLPTRLAAPLVTWGILITLVGLLLRSGLGGDLLVAGAAAGLINGIGLLLLWVAPLRRALANGGLQLGSVVGNTGYFGIPVALALLPPQALGYSITYDLVGTLITWSVGPLLIGGLAITPAKLLAIFLDSPALKGLAIALAIHLSPWGDAVAGLLWIPSRLVLLLALPCAMALLLFPAALVSVLYHYGAFTERDVAMTVLALRGYGAGLLGLIAIKVLAPAYYARLDVRTPVKIALGILAATQAMNLVLVPWLGHAGLALSIGLGALFNAGFLLRGLLRQRIYRPRPGWGAFTLRVVLANLLLAAALAWAGWKIDWIALQAAWAVRAAAVAGVLAGVALLYFLALLAMGLRPRDLARLS